MTTDGSASKGPPDPAAHFNTLIGAYTEAIRVSDFKANLAVLFVAIMMGPIVAYRGKYPSFLSLPLVLAPFLPVDRCLSPLSQARARQFPGDAKSAQKRFRLRRK
jgi:hypothetical protein